MRFGLLSLLALLICVPAAAQDDTPEREHKERDAALRLAVHGGAFSADSDRTLNPCLGYSLEGSLRFGALGIVVELGQHLWPTLEWDWAIRPGVLTAALGGELLYRKGRLRSSLALGTSTLLYETGFGDGPLRTGPFVHFVPIAVRVPMGQHFALELRPLVWLWAAPVLERDWRLMRSDIVFSVAIEVGS